MTLLSPSRLLTGLALVLLPATAVAAEPALSRFTFQEPHMGTLFRIIVYAPSKDRAQPAARAAFARIRELNGLLSDYDPKSELMRLCARAGGPPVRVSEELFFVLTRAQEVSRKSEGAFDVTVGPVVRLWRRARRTQKMPDPDKLAAARALVGYRNICLDEKTRSVQLLRAGMLLDLGGIAKGYAADEALAVLKKQGLTRALIAAGGDITVSGPPPDAPGWRVAIKPLPGETVAGQLILHDAAVSTSGDAEQFVVIDGKRYSHIVDPRTGLGLIGRMSATVVAPRGIIADSHTKVLCVLGPERGMKIIAQTPGVSGRMIYETNAGLRGVTSKRFPKLVPPASTDSARQGASPP